MAAILPSGVVHHPADIKAHEVKFPGYNGQEFLSVVGEEDLQKTGQWLRNRPNAQANGDLRGSLAFPDGATYVKVHIGLVGFCSEQGSPGLRLSYYRIERHRQLLLQRDT